MALVDAGRPRRGFACRPPREFPRALGAMVAEQAGPRGRIALLRNAVEGRMFSAAHKSQTVYHGPVANLDDPTGVGRTRRRSWSLRCYSFS